jgi:DNA mismatch repair protein MutS2
MKQAEILLFRRREKQHTEKLNKKMQEKFEEISGQIAVGMQVKIVTNRQVGKVLEIRDKRAIVKIGNIPINVKLSDLVLVQEKPAEKIDEGR